MKTKNENRNHREERRQTESAPDAFSPSVVSILKETDMRIGTKAFDQAVAKHELTNKRTAALKRAEKKMTEALEILKALEPKEHFDDIRHFRAQLQEILECDGGEAGLRPYIKNFCK